jgi:hypothetical protein
MPPSINEIRSAIAAYAPTYAALQRLQVQGGLLPPGDQKTGCIGEFYGQLYLMARSPKARIAFGGHSNKCWDFRVEENGRESLIQVKTVSQYSTTRLLSPLHHGWQELFVFFLDSDFLPTGFWIVADSSFVERSPRKGLRCPTPDGKRLGSRAITFGVNRIQDWRQLTGFDVSSNSSLPVGTSPAREGRRES